jgi:predicted DNA-binding WGR domain protein
MPERLLALEIRTSRLGFAVFEGPTRLLDWGVRSFGEQSERLRSTISDRISTLLAFHKPVAVVVRHRESYSELQNKRFSVIISAIREEAKRNSTKFYAVTTRQVRDCFASNGRITKHDTATSIAKLFEELSWKLPHRRKFYQSEAPVMAVFDAVANGIAFFRKQNR